MTCVRFSEDGHSVFSGSADRSIKVWDIRARTYRQTVTLRHSSTCNCIDVGSNGVDLVSGHHDGGLRFWDVRSGERTMDIPGRLGCDVCHSFSSQRSNPVTALTAGLCFLIVCFCFYERHTRKFNHFGTFQSFG